MQIEETTKLRLGELLQAVEEIGPLIRVHAAEAEENRRLSTPVSEAMREAGLLRMWAPKAFGGDELDPVTALKVIEAVSRHDSAAGWNLQLTTAIHPFLAWLPDEGIEEIYAAGPDQVMGGALFPPGNAIEVDGGYRLTGRWPFVSGSHQCNWYVAPFFIMDGDKPRLGENSQSVQVISVFSSKDSEIQDTWNTVGMRGTGSHDVVVKDIFIPSSRTALLAPLETPSSVHGGPLYRMTVWPSVAALAPPALGIARSAISDLIDLAKKKTPFYTANPLRERVQAQFHVAEAEAKVGAGRAYLYEALNEGWETAQQGSFLSFEQKMKILLATAYAIRSSADAVDLVHEVAGTSAIRNQYQFQKYFRDVHTITQHAHSSTSRYQSVGKPMFGLESDWPFLAL